MHIPKYWAQGVYQNCRSWGWSDFSQSEARTNAEQSAHQLYDRLKNGFAEKEKSYFYAQGKLREEPIKEISRGGGDTVAVITRNRAGCLVLNTAEICFIDIDFPDSEKPESFFKLLFGFGKSSAKETEKALFEQSIQKVDSFFERHTELGARLYSTRAGLRVMIVNKFLKPDSSLVASYFEELGADPLYVRLCKAQSSFRARLTPKPWRCGMCAGLDVNWPFQSDKARAAFERWIKEYQQGSSKYATCKLLKTYGVGRPLEEISEIIELHDSETRANTELELA